MLDKIQQVMREAGEMMLRARDSSAHVKAGHYNYATDTDLAVQNFLIERLSALCPEASFFAEEKDNAALTPSPTFVIDPIDGTLNFMRHRDHSCISVALLYDRAPKLAAVYNPYRDEMFTAEKSGGAFMNGSSIHASEVPFESAMVGLGTAPYNSDLVPATMKAAREFLLRAGDLRRLGSAALDLCDLACGRVDVYYEMVLSPWDFAAASLISQEAGAVFATPPLPSPDYSQPHCVLAANRPCYEKSLEIVLSAMDAE